MLRQIELLTKLQLVNLFGLNEARHAPSRRKKRELAAMAALLLSAGALAVATVMKKKRVR